MSLSLSFAKLLMPVLEGGTQTYGSFKGNNRFLVERLISDGVLDVQFVGAQRRRVYCNSVTNLNNYLFSKHGITSLREYIRLLENDDMQRHEAVRIASDSKAGSSNVFSGFFVCGIGCVSGTLEGNEISLQCIDGAHLFIHRAQTFQIPNDVVVVVVENYQNFKECRVLASLFKADKLLFIWRYQNSKTVRGWLAAIPNRYIHFGDFDPMGLQIYVTEFRRHLPAERCSFYFPENLNDLMEQYGRRELFENQKAHIENFDGALFPELIPIITVIKKHRKGLEQEVLIPTSR